MLNADYGQGDQTLSRAAGLVQGARADFDRLAKQLDADIAGLRGQWVGAGGAAFFNLHRAWDERQRTIVAALDDFERSLRATEKDNVATDDTQSAAMSKLAGRLG